MDDEGDNSRVSHRPNSVLQYKTIIKENMDLKNETQFTSLISKTIRSDKKLFEISNLHMLALGQKQLEIHISRLVDCRSLRRSRLQCHASHSTSEVEVFLTNLGGIQRSGVLGSTIWAHSSHIVPCKTAETL